MFAKPLANKLPGKAASLFAALCSSVLISSSAYALSAEYELATEVRYFNHESQVGQEDITTTFSIDAEFVHEWFNGDLRMTVSPFARVGGADEERRHADLREANFWWFGSNWEVLLGITKVFWGALESAHLVDIINQTDLVENIDTEDKLGQPMLRVTRYLPFGAIDAYLMSGFRERTFPGEEGRFRAQLAVDTDNPEFESEDGKEKLEYALRFSSSIGSMDYGITYFEGNGREPRLLVRPVFNEQNQPVGATLIPRYEEIRQLGFDSLWALGGLLVKAEAFYREDQLERFAAAGLGGEYTLVGIFGSADLGLLAEYLYDGRETQQTIYQNDVFAGLRLALNNQAGTAILAGVVRDLDDVSRVGLVEASRRINESVEMAFEVRWLGGFPDNSDFKFSENDDYAQLELRWYF